MSVDSGEVRIKNEATGGEKGQKLERHDLLPVRSIRAIARHFGVGAKKYEDRNWERGYNWSLSYGALQRHLTAWWGGEDIDEETQSSHLAAAGFHILALLEFLETHPELDDRPGVTSWAGGVIREDVEPRPFQVGDAVRHHCGEGVITALDDRRGGDCSIHFDTGGLKGRDFGALQKNLILIEAAPEPEPAPTGRVSVNQVRKALSGTGLIFEVAGFSLTKRGFTHEEIVIFLDALEDAGCEITHAPRD